LNIALIDNYDSFTFMLKDYIEQCGVACKVLRNDDTQLDDAAAAADCLVISPGPQTPVEAGYTMKLIEKYKDSKPILGVCLGYQAIGNYFGAILIKANKPMHGKIDTMVHSHHPMFDGFNAEFRATRYHSLILQDIKAPLKIIAQTKEKEVMAIAHNSLPIWGVQFHPESCTTENGLQLIKNFLHLARQNR
jgi:para-aminobenzoate synthetase component II